MQEQKNKLKLWGIVALILILMGALLFIKFLINFAKERQLINLGGNETPVLEVKKADVAMKKFKSEEEFKQYILDNQDNAQNLGWGRNSMGFVEDVAFSQEKAALAPTADGIGSEMAGSGVSAGRVSETNVQVAGIDEMDIVKTDGKQIYFYRSRTPGQVYSQRTGLSSSSAPAVDSNQVMEDVGDVAPKEGMRFPGLERETAIIKAFPPAEMAKLGTLPKAGDMLLKDKYLTVLANDNKIYGFDINNAAEPKELWQLALEEDTSIVNSRLMGDRVYLITKTNLKPDHPCPIEPFSQNGEKISITCTEIYYPGNSVAPNATYNVMAVDLKTGAVEAKSAFVGSYGQTTIYMSPEAIYVAYPAAGDYLEYVLGFLGENEDLFPNLILERLEKVNSYDLSQAAKLTELEAVMDKYYLSLSNDEELKLKNEVGNRLKDYAQKHIRELEKTGIAKVSTKDLEIKDTGVVGGSLLNQFSMDEYDGKLRVATTVSGSTFWVAGFNTALENMNDVYVLDDDMDLLGAKQNLALGERIYSARFIGERGYLVTFKQVDPFFVLDLSDPKNPEVKGELKIPGYSAYLHPLKENLILGIGEEDNKVKASIFDVSNPANPKEVSKYNLEDYYSAIQNTHHAFLQDAKHGIFFLPGSQGGYIFSYEDGGNKDQLKLLKAVSDINASRAVFLDDYLYIIGENKIRVFNEKNWEEVNNFTIE